MIEWGSIHVGWRSPLAAFSVAYTVDVKNASGNRYGKGEDEPLIVVVVVHVSFLC
jgi:hypothetical protein